MSYVNPYHRQNENGENPGYGVPTEEWLKSERFFKVDPFEQSAIEMILYWIHMQYMKTMDERYFDPDDLLRPFEWCIRHADNKRG